MHRQASASGCCPAPLSRSPVQCKISHANAHGALNNRGTCDGPAKGDGEPETLTAVLFDTQSDRSHGLTVS